MNFILVFLTCEKETTTKMIIITDIMVANIFFYIDIGCYDPCKYLLGSLTPLYYPLYTVHDINTNKKDFLVNIIAYLK